MNRHEHKRFEALMKEVCKSDSLNIHGRARQYSSDSNGYYYEIVTQNFLPKKYSFSIVLFYDSFASGDPSKKVLYAGFLLKKPAFELLDKAVPKSCKRLDNDSIERNEFWHSTAKISFQKLYMENYSKGGVAYWYGMYFDPGQGDDQWIAQSSKIRSFIEKQSLFILDVLLKDDMDKIDETIEGELVDVGGGLARSRKSNLYRTIVIVRAQGRCQACKWYAKIGDQYILDIHHLIPIKKGEQRVTLDKLVALCPTCHRIAHSRPEPLKLAEIMRKAKRRN